MRPSRASFIRVRSNRTAATRPFVETQSFTLPHRRRRKPEKQSAGLTIWEALVEAVEKVVFAFSLSYRSIACEREFQEIRVFLQPQRLGSAAGRARRARTVRWNPLLGHIRGPRSDSHQFGTECALSDLSVKGGLRTQPIAVGQAEEAAKPRRSRKRTHFCS